MSSFPKSLQFWKFPLTTSHLGLAAIILAALLWSVAAIVASKLFQAGVSPFELATARAVIAAVGLGVVSHRGRSWKQLGDWRILALGISLATVTVTYYVAIDRLSVAVALVVQYTAPAIVVALTAIKTQRLPTPTTLMAVTAAMIGVALVSGLWGDRLNIDGLGLIAAGLSALSFASYTLLSETVVQTYGAMGVMFRAFVVSSLFWVTFQCTQGIPTALFTLTNLPGILFVGIGGTLVPFSLLCWGIQQVSAERAVIAATLEPVIATGLAWMWLGQTLDWLQLLGGVLVLMAVLSLQLRSTVSP